MRGKTKSKTSAKPSKPIDTPADEFDQHYLVTLPESWDDRRKWEVLHHVQFSDGIGVLNMEAIRANKPHWFKLEAGKQIKAANFSLAEYVRAFKDKGATIESISGKKAKEIRMAQGQDEETRLRALGLHEKADKLSGKRIADKPPANEAEADSQAQTKAEAEVHKDNPAVDVKPVEKAPHETLED